MAAHAQVPTARPLQFSGVGGQLSLEDDIRTVREQLDIIRGPQTQHCRDFVNAYLDGHPQSAAEALSRQKARQDNSVTSMQKFEPGVIAGLHRFASFVGFSNGRCMVQAMGTSVIYSAGNKITGALQLCVSLWTFACNAVRVLNRLQCSYSLQDEEILRLRHENAELAANHAAMTAQHRELFGAQADGRDIASHARQAALHMANNSGKRRCLQVIDDCTFQSVPVPPHLIYARDKAMQDGDDAATETFKAVRHKAEKAVRKEMGPATRAFFSLLGKAWGLPHEPFRALGYQLAGRSDKADIGYEAGEFVQQLIKCSPHKERFKRALTRKPHQRKALFRELWAKPEDEVMQQVQSGWTRRDKLGFQKLGPRGGFTCNRLLCTKKHGVFAEVAAGLGAHSYAEGWSADCRTIIKMEAESLLDFLVARGEARDTMCAQPGCRRLHIKYGIDGRRLKGGRGQTEAVCGVITPTMPLRGRSARALRTMSTWMGGDDQEQAQLNCREQLAGLMDLQKRGITFKGRKCVGVRDQYDEHRDAADIHGETPSHRRSFNEEEYEHWNVHVWITADMKAGWGLFGHRGIKDNNYCMRCMATKDTRDQFFRMLETSQGMTIARVAEMCMCDPEDILSVNAEPGTAREAGLKYNTCGRGKDMSPGFHNRRRPRTDIALYDGFRYSAGDPKCPPDHIGGAACPCSRCQLPLSTRLRVYLMYGVDRPQTPGACEHDFELLQTVIDALHCRMRITEPLLHVLALQAFYDGRLDAWNAKLEELKIGFKAVTVEGDNGKLGQTKLDGPKCVRLFRHYEEIIKFTFAHNNPTPAQQHTCSTYIRLWKLWVEIDSDLNTCARPSSWSADQHTRICWNFKRLSLYWCEALTSEHTKSIYLHTLFGHGAEYWLHMVSMGLAPGMFSTDAAELRHLAFGRPAYARAQNCGLGGRKRKVRDEDGNVVLDSDGNPTLLEPTRHISDVPGCHRSYLTCREMWLLDWGEMNPRCLQCHTWRNQCVCAAPQFKEPPGFSIQYKRRAAELAASGATTSGSWVPDSQEASEVRAHDGNWECSHGCGWSGTWAAVQAHEYAHGCERVSAEKYSSGEGSSDSEDD